MPRLATARPRAVKRNSGSRVMFPTTVTVFVCIVSLASVRPRAQGAALDRIEVGSPVAHGVCWRWALLMANKLETVVTMTVHRVDERIRLDGAHEVKPPVGYPRALLIAVGKHFVRSY